MLVHDAGEYSISSAAFYLEEGTGVRVDVPPAALHVVLALDGITPVRDLIAQVVEELIQLAQDMRQANARGEALGLSEDELAFYDALETNDSAVQVLGDATLRAIAQELVRTVRANVTIDWTLRENVRAQLRVLVKRILRKHGYPPDKQEQATHTVLEQAEMVVRQAVRPQNFAGVSSPSRPRILDHRPSAPTRAMPCSSRVPTGVRVSTVTPWAWTAKSSTRRPR